VERVRPRLDQPVLLPTLRNANEGRRPSCEISSSDVDRPSVDRSHSHAPPYALAPITDEHRNSDIVQRTRACDAGNASANDLDFGPV
jgi:hypothetical protein